MGWVKKYLGQRRVDLFFTAGKSMLGSGQVPSLQTPQAALIIKNTIIINVDSTHGSQHLDLSYGILLFYHATFHPCLISECP